jgi:hypothetical protein
LWRNFDQIIAARARRADGFLRRHNAELLSFFVNDAHLLGANAFIDPNLRAAIVATPASITAAA